MRIDLNGSWSLNSPQYSNLTAEIPGSVLSTLLAHGLIEDPYYRDNEAAAREVLMDDYTLTRNFSMAAEQLKKVNYLFADGVDTIAKIYINGSLVAELSDMNIKNRILLDNKILSEENEIRVEFQSPYSYIRNYDDKGLFATFALTEKNSPCIRKANYMFGWDWGPNLADMGIFRDISVFSTELGYLEDFRHECTFLPDGKVHIDVEVNVNQKSEGTLLAELSLNGVPAAPAWKGTLQAHSKFSFLLENPQRWYPIGFGDPTLYDLRFVLRSEAGEEQCYSYRIGIREVKIDDKPDEYGTNFAVYINGAKVFLKGGCYIPEDNILSRCSPERTRRLLQLVKDFNHNVVRVWGGGYYPDEDFYDYCDENGILVWQDLMFACSAYSMEHDQFRQTIIEETADNVKRFRHHASVFLIAGDNECEDGVNGHEPELMENYRRMSVDILVPLMNELTSTYFLRTSPRSAVMYQHPNDADHYDTHYWRVWFDDAPIEQYLTVSPRMASEFGHQSFPMMGTICQFAKEDEQTLLSPVMQHHQKQPGSNTRILNYIRDIYGEPERFEDIVYLSQLVQAEAMKLFTEHMRASKFRCNGAIYWQLNDCWPGISWSSIDYNFGVKLFHYYSKKMFAPHLVSIKTAGDTLKINISNDTAQNMAYRLTYRYQTFDGLLIEEKTVTAAVEAGADLDAMTAELPASDSAIDRFVYVLLEDINGEFLSDNYYQKRKDREITYQKPKYFVEKLDANSFSITADTFVKNVFIQSPEVDTVFSDNGFCMQKNMRKTITADRPIDLKTLEITSVNQVKFKQKGREE